MSIDDTLDKESFNKNYAILKEISERLQNQTDPDIDALVPMVEKATKAYQICKDRLEKADAALKEHLPVNTRVADKEDEKNTSIPIDTLNDTFADDIPF